MRMMATHRAILAAPSGFARLERTSLRPVHRNPDPLPVVGICEK
jgi:hypothetical protein